MRRRRRLVAVALAVLGGAVAGCGEGSQVVVRPPATRVPATSVTPTPSKSVKINPRIVADPSKSLRNGETVRVTATGFGPNQALLALQCAVRGNKTGEGDCDLGNLVTLNTNAEGRGTARLTLHTGRIGANHDPCDHSHPCLVSVSQETLNPTQSATTSVTFQ